MIENLVVQPEEIIVTKPAVTVPAVSDTTSKYGLANALAETRLLAFSNAYTPATMAQIIDWRIANPTNDVAWNNWYTANNEEFAVKVNGDAYALFVPGIRVHTPELIRAQIDGKKLYNGASVIVPGTDEYRQLEKLIDGAVPHTDYLKNPAKYGFNPAVLAPMSVIAQEASGYMPIADARKSVIGAIRLEGKERLTAWLDVCASARKYENAGIWNDLAGRSKQPNATGRVLFVGINYDDLDGYFDLNYNGRFVGVDKNHNQIMPRSGEQKIFFKFP